MNVENVSNSRPPKTDVFCHLFTGKETVIDSLPLMLQQNLESHKITTTGERAQEVTQRASISRGYIIAINIPMPNTPRRHWGPETTVIPRAAIGLGRSLAYCSR